MLYRTETKLARRGTWSRLRRLPMFLCDAVVPALFAGAATVAFVVLSSAYCAARACLRLSGLSADRVLTTLSTTAFALGAGGIVWITLELRSDILARLVA